MSFLGEEAGCQFSFLFFFPLFFFLLASTFLCGVLCFVPASPTSSQHFISQNCSCCDDVTKTDINIASVPCLLEACNTNKKHRLPRKSCASPSGCGAVRARRKSFRQSRDWSEQMQHNRSHSSHRASTGNSSRCLQAWHPGAFGRSHRPRRKWGGQNFWW